MKLTYHQKVFDLLQRTPTLDSNAEEKLRAVEEAYGLVLPPSVREWYSLNEAIPILQESDECTYYITLQEMFAQKWLNDDRVLPKYEHPTIPMGCDQCAGIGIIALAITNYDEPYVASYVEESEWYKHEPLSKSILKWTYDSLYDYKSRGYQARAYNAILTESDYQTISQHFIEKSPIPPIRIFQYDDQLIHTWDHYWKEQQTQTYLWLHADTPESYRDLLRRFWNIGNLSTALYGRGFECWRIFEEFRPIKRQKSSDTPKEWGEKDILF
jgi:hypothetical protein